MFALNLCFLLGSGTGQGICSLALVFIRPSEIGHFIVPSVRLSVHRLTFRVSSVSSSLFFRKAKFMYKVYNGLTPSYINENFELRGEKETLPALRSSAYGCFIPPKPNKELFKDSMRYSGCLVWNSLPNDIKKSWFSRNSPQNMHQMAKLMKTRVQHDQSPR